MPPGCCDMRGHTDITLSEGKKQYYLVYQFASLSKLYSRNVYLTEKLVLFPLKAASMFEFSRAET